MRTEAVGETFKLFSGGQGTVFVEWGAQMDHSCKLSLFYEKDLTITIADANSLIKVPSGNPLVS